MRRAARSGSSGCGRGTRNTPTIARHLLGIHPRAHHDPHRAQRGHRRLHVGDRVITAQAAGRRPASACHRPADRRGGGSATATIWCHTFGPGVNLSFSFKPLRALSIPSSSATFPGNANGRRGKGEGGGGAGRPTAGNSPVLDQRASGVSARGGLSFWLSLLRPWHICYAVMLNQTQTKENGYSFIEALWTVSCIYARKLQGYSYEIIESNSDHQIR